MSPSDDQPGLRLRLAHEAKRIAVQHGYLAALEATTLRALERNTPAEAREALHGFFGALDAHFELEERVHFPAIHGLHADLGADIARLVEDHRALRAALSDLEVRVGREPRDRVTEGFRVAGAQLLDHERREETLIAAALERHEEA
jgi:hypothetical protein